MKTLKEVQSENLLMDVFTIEEFLQLLKDGDVSPYDYDSYGYYHDGENLTEEQVYVYEQHIIEMGEKYPYIVWRFMN